MIDLDKTFEDAKKEKEAILEELAPLRAEEKKLIEQFHPIDQKLRAVREKIADIEKKRDLANISRTIARLIKPGSGNKTLKAETGNYMKK